MPFLIPLAAAIPEIAAGAAVAGEGAAAAAAVGEGAAAAATVGEGAAAAATVGEGAAVAGEGAAVASEGAAVVGEGSAAVGEGTAAVGEGATTVEGSTFSSFQNIKRAMDFSNYPPSGDGRSAGDVTAAASTFGIDAPATATLARLTGTSPNPLGSSLLSPSFLSPSASPESGLSI